MTLQRLQPGQRFRLVESPELGTAVLLLCNDCRALIRWDRQPEYVHYETAQGRTVEFYRAARPESITPFVQIERMR